MADINISKKITISILFAGILAVYFFIFFGRDDNASMLEDVAMYEGGKIDVLSTEIVTLSEGIENNTVKKEKEVKVGENVQIKTNILSVPFIVQAPLGNWDNPVFQDACEEAAIVMAEGWLDGEKMISNSEAVSRIKEVSLLAEKEFNTFIDASIDDTSFLLNKHYGKDVSKVKKDIDVEDIDIIGIW